MPNRKTIASVLIFAGSALCFFLPFVTVSCGGMKVATFTGQQIATGIHSKQAQPFGPVKTENYGGDPYAGVAFLCAIAGIGLSLAGRRLAAGAAASGGVGAIAAFVMKSRLDEQLKNQSMGLAQVSYEPGFMLAASLLIAGFAWNLYLFFRSRQAASADDTPQPVNGSIPTRIEPAAAVTRLESYAGAPVLPVSSSQARPHSVAVTAATRYCTQCGSVISPGKRFCRQCGEETAQQQAATERASAAPAEASSPLPAAAMKNERTAPTAAAAFTAGEVVARFRAPEPAPSQVSIQAPAIFGAVSAEELAVLQTEQVVLKPHGKRTRRIGWLIGATAVVLAISGVSIWTFEWRKGINLASISSSTHSTQSVPQQPATSTGNVAKPSPAGQVTGQAPQAPAPNTPKDQVKKVNPGAEKPAQGEVANITQSNNEHLSNPPNNTGTVISPPVPSPPKSGALHYSGPPVQYGETVTFTNLPGGRLRFSFDRAAWQPLISRQPDGTQTLTLRSIKQGAQTQCDVGWEIVQ